MAEPPPPYSDTAVSQNHAPQRDPVTQLRRYLVEITAYSFNADFVLLNHALGQPTSSTSASISATNSTLTENERVELLRLALISKDLYGKHRGHELLTTLDSDRRAIANAILIPSIILDLSESYILQLISTYADHQCDEHRRENTLISQRIPQPLCLYRRLTLFLYSFSQQMNAHTRIILASTPNEDARMVLGEATRVFQQEELGIKSLPYCDEKRWPNYFGPWHDLKKAIRSEAEWDLAYGEMLRRRSKEAKRMVRINE